METLDVKTEHVTVQHKTTRVNRLESVDGLFYSNGAQVEVKPLMPTPVKVNCEVRFCDKDGHKRENIPQMQQDALTTAIRDGLVRLLQRPENNYLVEKNVGIVYANPEWNDYADPQFKRLPIEFHMYRCTVPLTMYEILRGNVRCIQNKNPYMALR